jgi:crotonobetainyl-CoA:carnitine CoA-transferase CaiB-like acyl-CoA transferase
MHEHGMAPDWLREQDWEEFDLMEVEPDVPVRLAEAFAAFFAVKTKAELLDWAIAHGIMLAPVQSLHDVLNDKQLAFRQVWRSLELAEGEPTVRVPGPPIRLSEGGWEPRGAPPALGAGNAAIYGELGYTLEEIAALKQRGVI